MTDPCQYALSLKQPWATLLVHAVKTMEIRRWPTARRGRVLIHAATVPDDRQEAWELLPEELREAARLAGGIVGVGELTECLPYSTVEAFEVDAALHRNPRSWFEPGLYGFRFANLAPLPFRRYPGWMRFFQVRDEEPRRKSAAR